MYELVFLNMSQHFQQKEEYLIHIHKIVNISLEKGDTYNSVFKKLRERFDGKVEELKAVEDWISFNQEGQQDLTIFDAIVCESDKSFAVFNLKKN